MPPEMYEGDIWYGLHEFVVDDDEPPRWLIRSNPIIGGTAILYNFMHETDEIRSIIDLVEEGHDVS